MPSDGQDENPWTRPHAGPPPRRAPIAGRPPSPPRPPASRGALRLALGAAISLTALAGVGVGLALTRDDAPPAAPVSTVAMPVEVAAVAPPPVQPVGERLEVLTPLPPAPATLPALTIRPAPTPAPRMGAAAPVANGAYASARSPEPRPMPAPPRWAVDPAPEPPPPALARDEDPCGWTRSRGQQAVCSDGRLAEADLHMRRAYQAALRAGASPEALAEDQADWLEIREAAAARSPGAVASIYDQRIDELEALARSR